MWICSSLARDETQSPCIESVAAKIVAFSAHQSRIKNTETEFGGSRKVALILSWQWGRTQ